LGVPPYLLQEVNQLLTEASSTPRVRPEIGTAEDLRATSQLVPLATNVENGSSA